MNSLNQFSQWSEKNGIFNSRIRNHGDNQRVLFTPDSWYNFIRDYQNLFETWSSLADRPITDAKTSETKIFVRGSSNLGRSNLGALEPFVTHCPWVIDYDKWFIWWFLQTSYESLTVTIRDGHFWPKGKNFTCNVFTNFHAFPFLVSWLLIIFNWR